MKKLWRRIREFFRSGRNADIPTSHDGMEEAVEGEEVPAIVEVGTSLVAVNGTRAEDKYEKFRGTEMMTAIAPSGVWVVIKFSDAVEAGQYSEDFKTAQIVKAKSGEAAIMAVYKADLERLGHRADLKDAKEEDGRYVALDFYTGHRVEAAVTGEWNAHMEYA